MTTLARGISASATCSLKSQKLKAIGPCYPSSCHLRVCRRRQSRSPLLQLLDVLYFRSEPRFKHDRGAQLCKEGLSNQTLEHNRSRSSHSYKPFTCRAFDGSGENQATGPTRSKLVFLGTPEVAARVLSKLLDASRAEGAAFEVAAVVTQPASSRGRGRRKDKPLPTPVAALAAEHSFPSDRILTPATARDEDFLERLATLQPDLCVTAAYGNVLPARFLAIPRRGTVNIHPSLLPLYRGASPVQRALEDGVAETGVSLAFTVRAMDAGPIIAREEVAVDQDIKAPQLLEHLFLRGTQLLLERLPAILDGSAAERAVEQDPSQASHAAKVASEEGQLTFDQPAQSLHNKVRAFSGWPGSRAVFRVVNSVDDKVDEIVLKIITTRSGLAPGSPPEREDSEGRLDRVDLHKDALLVRCDDGSVLQVVELQPPGKQIMSARAFWNGLRGRHLYRT